MEEIGSDVSRNTPKVSVENSWRSKDGRMDAGWVPLKIRVFRTLWKEMDKRRVIKQDWDTEKRCWWPVVSSSARKNDFLWKEKKKERKSVVFSKAWSGKIDMYCRRNMTRQNKLMKKIMYCDRPFLNRTNRIVGHND